MTEKFVLSAHGSATFKENFMFTIPDNITLCTYGPLNTKIFFTNQSPNQICKNEVQPFQRFGPRQNFPNYVLWSDETKNFYSGVKRCIDNSIVLNIDGMPDIINTTNGYRHKTTLYYVVNYIKVNMPPIPIEIHLCICLGQVSDVDLLTMAMQSANLGMDDIEQITRGLQSLRLGGQNRKKSKRNRKSQKSQKRKSRFNRNKNLKLKY